MDKESAHCEFAENINNLLKAYKDDYGPIKSLLENFGLGLAN